ncbi:galactose-3-O-sulfotransferase 4-like [Gastrophryne carolinensis]
MSSIYPGSPLNLSNLLPPYSPTCQPKRHVVFLKTHKTASTTVQNILIRYGVKNNLTFALPVLYHFRYPKSFHSSYVKGFNGTRYDILCHHMRLNLSEVQKVMPEDSFYFTILREPASLAASTFSYFFPVFNKAPNLKTFLSNPSRYYLKNKSHYHLAHNPMWYDLGHDPDAPFTEKLVRAAVQAAEEVFRLVLITEYFDESMILLKEELCWELDDVVTFKLNSRNSSSQLEPDEVGKLWAWNNLDWYLYAHFNRTFWEKVERFGRQRMDNEVRRLRERRQQLARFCLESLEPVNPEDIEEKAIRPLQSGPDKIQGWVVKKDLHPDNRTFCIQMVLPEYMFKRFLDKRQFPKNG